MIVSWGNLLGLFIYLVCIRACQVKHSHLSDNCPVECEFHCDTITG